MKSPASLIFFALFALSIFVTYLIVRRTQRPILLVALIGGVVDFVLVGLYSLSSGNPPLQALVVGLVLGVLFDGLTITAAAFFRENETGKRQPRP